MITVEIKLWGIVQGVGFRPYIAKLAAEHNLRGWVSNEGGSVHIMVTGTEQQLGCFIKDIRAKKPAPSEIVYMDKNTVELQEFADFRIVESSEGENEIVFIPADLSICEDCERELFAAGDKRYLHPFISCMVCGPRYSIIDSIPYDRDNTSMVDFEMCDFCEGQYTELHDRRYHAQTISCHDCGPELIYSENESNSELFREEALEKAIQALKSGKIIAVKGIGGYHLVCSPFMPDAVENLRRLKGREQKPFAVMFADMEELRKYCTASEAEEEVLLSREKPIVLMERKPSDIAPSVYRSSRFLGGFLPYTPLQHLLLRSAGPLIMTSANISDRPIIKDDEEMLEMDSPYLEGVLYNERKIRIGIDDSVVKLVGKEIQFVRRARGYAPLPIFMSGRSSGRQVLACGGQLKNTFCLTKSSSYTHGTFAYMSQYIGDISDLENYEVYRQNIERMKSLLRIKPDIVCCDLHPDYLTTRYAESLGLEIRRIQHHYAHIAAVMAEKNISDEMIGVAFDGTGYGDDGRIWGGEFLLCSNRGYQRVGQLRYIPMLGGDTSMKESWKSACMYLYSSGLEAQIRDERWKIIKPALENNINVIESSSMGRLFDAASSILDIQQISSFEGESAIKLENEGAEFLKTHGMDASAPYKYDIRLEDGRYQIDTSQAIRGLLEDKMQGRGVQYASARFHCTIAALTLDTCILLREKYKLGKVALSGGVFQNSILFELTVKKLLEAGFEVYYNTIAPPNDGCISLGQAFAAL